MKKLIILTALLLCAVPVFAAEESAQAITNEKTYASIDLNSQVGQNGSIKKQDITNKGSWFNININRITYKIYVADPAVSDAKQ